MANAAGDLLVPNRLHSVFSSSGRVNVGRLFPADALLRRRDAFCTAESQPIQRFFLPLAGDCGGRGSPSKG